MTARERRRRARRAGFTLVELMVSLTIGAIVIATVYTIGGASARNFQEQQRVGQLQLSTRLALDRLRRDIERAGLHGTPSSTLERTCATPPRVIQAVSITHEEASSRAAINAHEGGAANSTTQADRLRLVGNFATSDAYLMQGFNGAGNVAFLQTSWQGFRRSFVRSVDPSTGAATFDDDRFAAVFMPGRMLHIRNQEGRHFFVTVQSASIAGAIASVSFTPAVPIGGTCVVGLGEGSLVAPLSEIEYALDAAPDDLVGIRNDAVVTGPNVGLVRRELNMATGAQISERTVLEWAVHFDVDGVFDNTPLGAPPSSAAFTFLDDVAATTATTTRPHDARSLIVSIGARTPEQDPDFRWVAPVPGGPLSRFRVFGTGNGAARVRTATTEVDLPNLTNRGM